MSQSRHHVTIHPDYTDMTDWFSEMETANTFYDDSKGDLTRCLTDTGHLVGEKWHHAQLRYWLDVKTTTGPCDTPFQMSKKQYERVSPPSTVLPCRCEC